MNRKLECRTQRSTLHISPADDSAGAETGRAGRTISGYAAVFNSWSQPLRDGDRQPWYLERIAPGAFRNTIAQRLDVRLLVNHNADLILGRTKSGTLRLSEDETGLKIEADLPDTQLGRDTAVSLRRGDLDQMSFNFYSRDETWGEEVIDGELWRVRTLLDLDIDDVSIVAYPAYRATSVAVRNGVTLDMAQATLDLLEIEWME